MTILENTWHSSVISQDQPNAFEILSIWIADGMSPFNDDGTMDPSEFPYDDDRTYNEQYYLGAEAELRQLFVEMFSDGRPVEAVIELVGDPENDFAFEPNMAPFALGVELDRQAFMETHVEIHPLALGETYDIRYKQYTYTVKPADVLQSDLFTRLTSRDFPGREPRWDYPNNEAGIEVYFVSEKFIYQPQKDNSALIYFFDAAARQQLALEVEEDESGRRAMLPPK